jgi:Tol biopolymer transport system component
MKTVRLGLFASLLLSSLLFAQDEVPLGDIARKMRAERAASHNSDATSQPSKKGESQHADPAQKGAIGDFAFSPDGQFIVLSRSNGSSSFLYRVALDTGKATRLTQTERGFEGSPSFSPDGKRIAFAYRPNRSSRSRIYIAALDGSGSHPLFSSDSDADDFSPVFTTNGDRVYFARSAFFGNYSPIARPGQHEWDIYSVDADGRNLRQITNEHFYQISAPSLSTDGKKMLFSTDTEDGSRLAIYTFDNPSKPQTLLQPHVPNEPRSPIFGSALFTPDGQNVLFLAASEGRRGAACDYDVYRMSLRGGSIAKLTSGNGYATGLCVSPDGRKAIFMKWTFDERRMPIANQLHMLNLETRETSPLPISGTR